jgi:hypothetical protein
MERVGYIYARDSYLFNMESPLKKANGSDTRLRVGNDALWLDAKLGEDWRVSYRLEVQNGRVIVAELRIFPRARPLRLGPGRHGSAAIRRAMEQGSSSAIPPGGLSTRLLRRVRLGHDVHSLVQIAEGIKRNDPAAFAPGTVLAKWGVTADVLFEAVPTRRQEVWTGRGRPSIPAVVYAALASEYSTLVAGGSDRPVQELAERSGQPLTLVRSRIQTARRLGLLDPGVQGNAGGQLTPAAKQLLRKKGAERNGKTARAR